MVSPSDKIQCNICQLFEEDNQTKGQALDSPAPRINPDHTGSAQKGVDTEIFPVYRATDTGQSFVSNGNNIRCSTCQLHDDAMETSSRLDNNPDDNNHDSIDDRSLTDRSADNACNDDHSHIDGDPSATTQGKGNRSVSEKKREDSRTHRSKKRLATAYAAISTFCKTHSIENIEQASKDLFKVVNDNDEPDRAIFRRHTPTAIVYGCIFIACRQHGVACTFNETLDRITISRKIFRSSLTFLEGLFKRHGCLESVDGERITISVKPTDLIDRYCGDLSLGNPVASLSRKLAKRAANLELLSGRSPRTCAAAYISLSCKILRVPKTLDQISVRIKISGTSIHAAYEILWSNREKIIEPELLNDIGSLSSLPIMAHSGSTPQL